MCCYHMLVWLWYYAVIYIGTIDDDVLVQLVDSVNAMIEGTQYYVVLLNVQVMKPMVEFSVCNQSVNINTTFIQRCRNIIMYLYSFSGNTFVVSWPEVLTV